MSSPAGRRGDDLRQAWFSAGYDLLAFEGYGGLKLASVCTRLSVTTGAFYHSFDSWGAYTAALLERWREDRTAAYVELVTHESDPVAQLEILAGASTDLQHRTEAAIRVWGAVDPAVGAVQRQVDDERLDVVHRAMLVLVGGEHADRFTSWAYTVLVGHEMLAPRFSSADLDFSLHEILRAAVALRDRSPVAAPPDRPQ